MATKMREFCKVQGNKVNKCVRVQNKSEAIKKLKDVDGKIKEFK